MNITKESMDKLRETRREIRREKYAKVCALMEAGTKHKDAMRNIGMSAPTYKKCRKEFGVPTTSVFRGQDVMPKAKAKKIFFGIYRCENHCGTSVKVKGEMCSLCYTNSVRSEAGLRPISRVDLSIDRTMKDIGY